MANEYNPSEIEGKWQKQWEEAGIYEAKGKGEKYYALIEFPYPSGDGLHVGHPRPYIGMDVVSRKCRMQGFDVLYPIGWDAFGLPTENYAIKTGKQPAVITKENTDTFRRQIKSLGISFDWSREINTTDPKYYKWTQWLFLQFLKHGLAYKAKALINWCPKDKIGLANEEVVDGKCERCGTPVEQKEKEQWMLGITKYAERLLKDLDEVDYPERVKAQQRNWIGKSEGAEIEFPIVQSVKPNFIILHGYTGRADTNFIPWLKNSLKKKGYRAQAPQLPNTDKPTEEEQVNYVLENCDIDENTIIVGHSLGAIVAMKAVLKLGRSIKGLVLVAAAKSPTVSSRNKPYHRTFSWDYDYEALKKLTEFRLLLSDLQEVSRFEYLGDLSEKLNAPILSTLAVEEHFCATEEPFILEHLLPSIKVFTTRPDTIYGTTFLVVAGKEDKFTGKYVTNPATKEKIPVWEAEYVLSDYGTGAIMGVPAHDERDYEFAKKHNLPIKRVIEPIFVTTHGVDAYRSDEPLIERETIVAIVKHWSEDKYIGLKWKKVNWQTLLTGGPEGNHTLLEGAINEIREETGYKNPKLIAQPHAVHSKFFHVPKKINRFAHLHVHYFELQDGEKEEISDEEKGNHDVLWLTPEKMEKFITPEAHLFAWREFRNGMSVYQGDGILVNSGKFNSKDSNEIKRDITEFVGGKWTTKFKLRDWIFSRQRYWGEPIPVIHCDKCGVVPVPEQDLPVELPPIDKYEPTDTGESPLANIKSFVDTECPRCGGKGKRETDVMPNWAGSSWYFYRYADHQNDKEFASKKALKYWMPVDWYNGGMEHTTLHLLYSRFWNKFLFDIGLVPTNEPYKKRTSHGIILASDGRKMSKSLGNVVNPDDIVKRFGADTLRLYEMFMGPFEQAIAWNDDAIVGSRRFLERVWKVSDDLTGSGNEILMNQTIKKVSDDIETLGFNTAISSLMVWLNRVEKFSQKEFEVFLKLLAPFAPHVVEELWSKDHKTSIHAEAWPKYDESKLEQEVVTYAVQVNGKVRANFETNKSMGEQELKEKTLALPEVKKWLEGKVVDKIIVVPRKVVNIVIA